MNAAVFSLLLLCGPPVDAIDSDYLLRVEHVGYKDAVVPENGGEPADVSLRTIETVCRLDQPFLARATVGPATTTISGVLRKADEGEYDFKVDLASSQVVDTGVTVPVAAGVEQKILDVTSSQSIVAVREGVAFEGGGVITRSAEQTADSPKPRTTMSKLYMIVTIEKHRPNSTRR